MLMMNTVLAHAPSPDRSSTGIGPDGSIFVNRVRMAGTWRGTGQRRPLVLNREPAAGDVAVHAALRRSDAGARGVELTLQPFAAAQPNRDLSGVVAATKQGGSTPIPPGGDRSRRRCAPAPAGSRRRRRWATIVVRLTLTPDWSQVVDAVGGGPVLVQEGRPVFRANELFTIRGSCRASRAAPSGRPPTGGSSWSPSTARRPGYSVGMTNFELALTMTGSAPSARRRWTAAARRLWRSRATCSTVLGPRRRAGRARSPQHPLLRRPRPSRRRPSFPRTATASRTPDADVQDRATVDGRREARRTRWLGAGARQRRKSTLGSPPALGRPGAEGTWRFVVSATDDLGRASTMERTFSLNNTLGACAWTRRRSRRAVRCGRRSRSRGRRRYGPGSQL